MAYSDIYKKQVQLLMRCIPYVAKEECFALKGGTAINLFCRDMPRLSVDIDLTYLPNSDRMKALKDTDAALKNIAKQIQKSDGKIKIVESTPGSQDYINKLIIRSGDNTQIKIETTPVLRGSVYKPKVMKVMDKVEEEFGFAEIKVLPFADLYAGKIMAALDRQHPRDLFDVQLLLCNEGIDDKLRAALIVYLISHGRPTHELLNPQLRDIKSEYEKNFVGMTEDDISLESLLATRDELIANARDGISDSYRKFLLSFSKGEPDWEKLGISSVANLPAVKWKLQNINSMDEDKRLLHVEKLDKVLVAN